MDLHSTLRRPVTRLGIAAILAVVLGIGVVRARGPGSQQGGEAAEVRTPSPAPKTAGSSSTSSNAGLATPDEAPTESQAKLSRAMDKTMASSLTQTFVEVVDRKDLRSAERIQKSLIAYKDVSREVIDELRAREPHLSEAAKSALQEVYDQAH